MALVGFPTYTLASPFILLSPPDASMSHTKFSLFFFFSRSHSDYVLSLFISKNEKKNDHQRQMAAAEATPKANFTLRRERCVSSSWH